MKTIFTAYMLLFFGYTIVSAQNIYEGFDDISTLVGDGWVRTNNSSPLGSTNWFQGNSSVFPANNGATNSYIGANFNNTTSNGTISNWLISPALDLLNGDTIRFYTRAINQIYPDRLEVRLSTNGNSSDAGSGAFDVGDFTTVLLEINPGLAQNTYPETWTQYAIIVSGLSDFIPTTGRVAFRYFVTDGGDLPATNSNYIGIDDFEYIANTTPPIPTLGEWALINLGVMFFILITFFGFNHVKFEGSLFGKLRQLPLNSGYIIWSIAAIAGLSFSLIVVSMSGIGFGIQDFFGGLLLSQLIAYWIFMYQWQFKTKRAEAIA